MSFQDLLNKTAAVAFDKQATLGDLIGSRNWQFDMDSGTVTFGSDLRFSVQLLGTESEYDKTWLWAWANRESGIPANLLQAAEQMRQYGEQHQLGEFTSPELQLTELVTGHHLSMAAGTLTNANGYYRGPYEGGALFMLIQDAAYPRPSVNPITRVLTMFPQVIMNVSLSDHRTALAYYLRYYGAEVKTEGNNLIGIFPNGKETRAQKEMRAEFDIQNRLTNMSGTA